MIKVTNERDGNLLCKPIREIKAALFQLINSELGFGGRIVELDETKICVHTQIMSCLDVTTFEGSKEDMLLLFEAAARYLQVNADKSPRLQELQIKDVMAITKGNPLMIKLGGDMIMSARTLKIVLTSMITHECSEDVAMKLLSSQSGDLFEAMWMVRGEGASLEDVLSIL